MIIVVKPEIRWKHNGKDADEITVYQVSIGGIRIPNKDKDAYYTNNEQEAVQEAFNNFYEKIS
jgi:hypothetical protein